MTLLYAAFLLSSAFIGALVAKIIWNLTHEDWKQSYHPTDVFGFLLSIIVQINHFGSYQ